jgi:uncharacterized protein (DUF362 family)
LADFDGGSIVHFPAGRVSKSFYLCRGVQEADALISLCKMRPCPGAHHRAMKNLYGCVAGEQGHGTRHVPTPTRSRNAVRLARCVKPRLHVMDGVMRWGGNGPTSGTPFR